MQISPDKQTDQNLIKLLKANSNNFHFNQTQIKQRLLQSIRQTPQAAVRIPFRWILEYGSAVALIIILATATFGFAANSNPGDKFFPINKWGEQVILSLPLNDQTIAQIHTNIVNKRLRALTKLENEENQQAQETPAINNRRLITVKESHETLSAAITTITAQKEALRASDNSESINALNQVLTRLENLAKQQEEKIEAIESHTQNDQVREEIEDQLKQIHEVRNQVYQESKIQGKSIDNEEN